MRTQKQIQTFHPEAGVTLMELIAALTVMAVIVVGALALYTSASSSQSSTQLIQDVTSIRSAVKSMWQGQGTYGTSVINDTLVAAKRIPTTIKVDTATTPNTLTHVLNGTITVTGATSTFTVAMTNITPDVCIPLLTTAQGWVSVQVASGTAITAFPIAPATAATSCGTTAATITFTGN